MPKTGFRVKSESIDTPDNQLLAPDMIVLVRVDHQLKDTSEEEKGYHYGIVSYNCLIHAVNINMLNRSQKYKPQLSGLLHTDTQKEEKTKGN